MRRLCSIVMAPLLAIIAAAGISLDAVAQDYFANGSKRVMTTIGWTNDRLGSQAYLWRSRSELIVWKRNSRPWIPVLVNIDSGIERKIVLHQLYTPTVLSLSDHEMILAPDGKSAILLGTRVRSFKDVLPNSWMAETFGENGSVIVGDLFEDGITHPQGRVPFGVWNYNGTSWLTAGPGYIARYSVSLPPTIVLIDVSQLQDSTGAKLGTLWVIGTTPDGSVITVPKNVYGSSGTISIFYMTEGAFFVKEPTVGLGKHIRNDRSTGGHNVTMYCTYDYRYPQTNASGGRTFDEYRIDLPAGRRLDEIVVAPDGHKVAFVLYSEAAPSRKKTSRCKLSEIWVCNADGRDMKMLLSHETVAKPDRDGAHADAPNHIQWLPGGEAVSYIYKGSLWRAPV